jgi:predicted ATPase/DNA-binding SARP family transcriptional activator
MHLFGAFRLERDGEKLSLKRRRTEAMAAYLAVTAQPQRREALAALFWPDHDPAGALANLRRVLSQLEAAMDDLLEIDRETAGLRDAARLWLDVQAFQSLLELARQHERDGAHAEQACQTCSAALAEAVELYSGEFMAGFSLPDSPAFDEWQFFQAEGLRSSLAWALQKLTGWHSRPGGYERAIDYARRWLALDPLHEPAHRRLMQLYAASGQGSAALRQYDLCVQILERELGISPEPETTALYDQIRRTARSGSGETKELPLSQTGRSGSSAAGQVEAPPSFRASLPSPSTSFVGRDEELERVQALLQDQTGCRLLTLLGPGGVGKTRLAIEAASRLAPVFPQGVYYASLAAIGNPEGLLPAIAEALGVVFSGPADPQKQLLSYLRNRKLLLVLDNFENVLPAAGLLSEMLAVPGGAALLATSRERLNLQEEWIYEVPGLSCPPSGVESLAVGREALESFGAVQLFLQRARQARVEFDLAPSDVTALVRICDLVGGNPLGLELAASWVRSLSLVEIAGEIERSLDFLAAPLRNLPERHRSLRAVFEQSWQFLPEADRLVLARLSVFRGGCQRHSAEAVAGATLAQLAALQDRSLLQRSEGGRYSLHELVRQFAAEKLAGQPDESDRLHRLHCCYYLNYLHEREHDFKGGRQVQAMVEIGAEIDNLRLAWQWAVNHADFDSIRPALDALWMYFDQRGEFREGEAVYRQAAEALTAHDIEDQPKALQTLAGELIARQGYERGRYGKLKEGQALIQRGLDLIRQASAPDRRSEGIPLMHLSGLHILDGHFAESIQAAEEGLAIFANNGDRWGMGGCLVVIGSAAQWAGQVERAERDLSEAVAICRSVGDRRHLFFALQNLFMLTIARGQYAKARALLDESMQISRDFRSLHGTADVLREYGRLATCLGDYKDALEDIQRSIAMFEDIGAIWDSQATLTYLGVVQRLLGDLERAEQSFQTSLTASQLVDHPGNIAYCRYGLGMVAFDRGDYPKAEDLFNQALEIYRRIGHDPEIAATWMYLGHTRLAQNETPNAAHPFYLQALESAVKQRLAPLGVDLLAAIAPILLREGEQGIAVELLSLARDHPTATFETRSRASRVLQALAGNLPDLVPPAPPRWGNDWQAAAKEAGRLLTGIPI